MMKLKLPALLLAVLLLAGCRAPAAAPSYRQITMDEAVAMMAEEENYIILDVRTAEEFAEKHIPGAVNVPNESIAGEVPELPRKDQLILVYCRSGNRSKQAARKLADAGYTNVVEFGGINSWPGETVSGGAAIPFGAWQYYAVAWLGYQELSGLSLYRRYLDGQEPPIHYISDGDYYLVIPRYEGMGLELYKNDLDASRPSLIYESGSCQPFIVQCNVSDIFPDVTIRLTHEEGAVEFSPCLSLKDGSLQIGEHGLELTREG